MFVLLLIFSVLLIGPALLTEPPAPFSDHCIIGEKSLYPPDPIKNPALPKATINLDLPPNERWVKFTTENAEGIRGVTEIIKNLTRPLFGGKAIKFIDQYLGEWDEAFPYPYRDEIRSISKATEIPLGELVLFNIFYEITAMCTAIVAQDSDGNMLHARNMDFGIFTGWDYKTHEWVTPKTINAIAHNVDFMKNGKLLYQGVVFPGHVGQFSSIKPGKFALTLNERYSLKGGYLGILRWILGFKDFEWATLLSREVMETVETFEEAKEILSTTRISSPMYYLISGTKPGQASLISRSLGESLNPVEFGNKTKDNWYILQTNYDHWKEPLYLDDRRTAGNVCIRKVGQKNINFGTLFDVLSSKPNKNMLTLFTHLMNAKDGKNEVYRNQCEQPCWFV